MRSGITTVVLNAGRCASTIVYMTSGFDGAIAMRMRPFSPSGNPFPFTSVQVPPASVDFHSPEPSPPDLSEYGVRTRSHAAAQTVFGLRGSSFTSTKPALSLMNFTNCQVVPPSVVL